MIDIEMLKRSWDCRQIVERDLGKPKSRTKNYSTFKCPLHHEQKGFSLVVYATHWHCYGKCGIGGDMIGWFMRFHRLSFQQACEQLADGKPRQSEEGLHHFEWIPEPYAEPPAENWQRVA